MFSETQEVKKKHMDGKVGLCTEQVDLTNL